MVSTPPAGPLCTCGTVVEALRELGVEVGDVLLVHSSLSSLGFVNGGAEAVVRALLEVLGPTGTLVVPTHSSDNSDPAEWRNPPVPEEWWETIRCTMPMYNKQTTRTWGMGVIPETVRTWPFAVRSAHPQASFAAVGRRADSLMEDHSLDCSFGEKSPLAKLEKGKAKVLLLGVGFSSCTAFHLAEYRVPSPIKDNSFSVMTSEGWRWMTVRDVRTNEEGFEELGADFEKENEIRRGKVGAADARLFSLSKAVKFAEEWLPINRAYTDLI
jgi:aminoglycoside 3-N-acetyltransferase